MAMGWMRAMRHRATRPATRTGIWKAAPWSARISSGVPDFIIDGFSDISFAQRRGWALRASAKYQVTTRWSVEPYYIRWHVSASPVNYESVAFTVNNVTATGQLGFYEPGNVPKGGGPQD
jgi:hypothetical protein